MGGLPKEFCVKMLRLMNSQISAILKQNSAEAIVHDLCCEHGISSTSVSKWWAKFGDIEASLMKLMKELEDKNVILKNVRWRTA
jgi:putative transposase